jgi:GT2 family glycosyltransferase
LQELARQSSVPVKLEQRRCNIAQGRNRAIQLTDAEILAATDAGSFPEREWFDEITRPLLANPALDFTGGRSVPLAETVFQKFLRQEEPGEDPESTALPNLPSSRNTAFRRQAWQDVGGYPEWLTLAAEDLLFTHELKKVGKKYFFNPRAVVYWEERGTEQAFFKMFYRNAYGSAEAQFDWPYFRRRMIIALCPPLLLLSRHRFQYLKFRYLKNYSSARGWLDGKWRGHHPPPGWKRVDGVLLSPEAQTCLAKND